MDVTRELISLYADGQVTAEERAAVESALRDDPQAAIDFDELKMLDELFGGGDSETVSEECLEKLYALDQAGFPTQAGVPAFERIELAPVRRIAWGGWAAAAAALFLAVYGLLQLTYNPEVTLRDFARLTLDADGNVIRTERLEAVTKHTGDRVVAGPKQRISYRDPLGARVILMPESSVEIGDPREGGLFELREGTALLTVYDSNEPRVISAAGYVVRSQGANFGVRVAGSEVRGAGAAIAGSTPKVTVAVRTGSCEVGENGAREQIDALWCVTLRRGKPVERARIWESPLYKALLDGRGYEIVPGFFSSESGVRAILPYEWDRVSASELEMLVSAHEIASIAQWIVAEVELDEATSLELIRTRPLRGGERAAEESIISTPVVPAGRRLVAIPLDAFDTPQAKVRRLEIPVARSYLVALRLRTEDSKSPLKIKASLWSARPPADASEVVR